MKILVILAHPRGGSFNHAVAGRVVQGLRERGHDVVFHDLYAEKFDPVITAEELTKGGVVPGEIRRHCEELAAAEGIVLVHPNWWGQPPAILKGWVDRVVRAGVAYRFKEGDSGEGVPEGLLKIKSALVLNTTDTPAEREQAVFGDPLETLWKKCIFDFCGVTGFVRKSYGVIVTSTAAERAAWLADVEQVAIRCFPEEGK